MDDVAFGRNGRDAGKGRQHSSLAINYVRDRGGVWCLWMLLLICCCVYVGNVYALLWLTFCHLFCSICSFFLSLYLLRFSFLFSLLLIPVSHKNLQTSVIKLKRQHNVQMDLNSWSIALFGIGSSNVWLMNIICYSSNLFIAPWLQADDVITS